MNKSIPNGLTSAEVKTRQLEGLDNSFKVDSSKSTWDIIRGNTFTLFNAVNTFIAICLLAVGSYSNALFMVFILNNIVVGIFVELRARNIVDKLMILNKDPICVIRDGKEVHISPDEIVLGDIIKLPTGVQVPSDAIVKHGTVEANEALLTGESDLIIKRSGSHLLSGSVITSGQCYAEVEHVGKDNYSTKLAIEAKVFKPITSELLSSLKTITKFTSRIVLPLGVILLLESLLIKFAGVFTHDNVQASVVSTASAILGMLPKGMAVLIVISLIMAIIKLGRKKVLVQDMYSIETMAYVNTLCLDKTGTITEGKMKVKDFKLLGNYTEKKFLSLLGSYLHFDTDNSGTMQAVRKYFKENDSHKGDKLVSFSSDRKWSSLRLKDVGTVVLGAPGRLLDKVPAEIEDAQSKGARVLLFGVTDQNITISSKPKNVKPIAMIELEDPIRKDADKTLKYLSSQGVDLKIISGDNPTTVSAIARNAGFASYENFIDTSTLTDEELRKKVSSTAIFGRVTPQQKKVIITHLKSLGRTVAMTGDGVNDILALREADLSIVMATGDSATKQIANLVLLESKFNDIPDVLFEARRVVNNMFRAGSIFFIKTIYSFFLVILCALSPLTGSVAVFPFVAIQITMLDQIIEGWPSFWLALESDRRPVVGNFLKTSLLRSLPNAILIAACVVFLHFFGPAQGWSQIDTATVMYYLLGCITAMNVVKSCLPLNKLHIFLIITTIGGFFLGAAILKNLIHVTAIYEFSGPILGVFFAMLAACIILRLLWNRFFEHKRNL